MTTPPISVAGDTPEDRRVWNTYLYWARYPLDPSTDKRRLLISPLASRLRRSTSSHLQTILFTAFAAEYRIKRIYDVLGVKYRKKDMYRALLDNFATRVQSAQRLDGRGPIILRPNWPALKRQLQRIGELGNKIAHANYHAVVTLLPNDARKSRAIARSCFNALVDFFRETNRAIGYEQRPRSEARRDYARLKVR